MVKPALIITFLFIFTINLIDGYFDGYGIGYEVRGDVGRDELDAKLYNRLDDNYGQEDDGNRDLRKEYDRLLRSYYLDPVVEENAPEKIVDKSKISETIEEDQELRRLNNSDKNKYRNGNGDKPSFELKALETISHGASNKQKGVQPGSEKSLPFYCHPPNPCPKGLTEKDGCLEFIEDTAEYQKEWNSQSQKKGLCQCDEEHMSNCNMNDEEDDQGSSESAGLESSELERVLESMAKENLADNPFTKGGQKRQTLVAKKLPRFKRDLEYSKMEEELSKMKRKKKANPFLQGNHLHTVAKKG